MVLWLDHQPIKQIHTQKLSDDPPSVWSMPSGDSQLDSIIPPRVLTHCHTGSHMHGAHHTDSHVLSHALPHTAHTLTHSPHTMHTHVPACGAHSSIRSHVRHTHHTRLHTHRTHTYSSKGLTSLCTLTLVSRLRGGSVESLCSPTPPRPRRSTSLCVGHGPPWASEKHY